MEMTAAFGSDVRQRCGSGCDGNNLISSVFDCRAHFGFTNVHLVRAFICLESAQAV